MRLTFPLMALIAAVAFLQIKQTTSLFPALVGVKAGTGAALAAVITPKVFVLPKALFALKALKLALKLGKPFLGALAPIALIALKKLLLKPLLGGLLLKLPLLLSPGPGLLAKLVALKLALITKGLIGIKAPIALLLIGATALGTGIGVAVALHGVLGKFKEDDYDDDYGYVPTSYALPQYTPPAPIYTPSYSAAAAAAPRPAGYRNDGALPALNTYRHKRDTDSEEDSSEEDIRRETSEEEDDDVNTAFEAARTNGDAYLYMAAAMDEKLCGRRLLCEIYQKPKSQLTTDEILLQDIFGYPLSPLTEEESGTARELYHRAALLGASSPHNPHVCARQYPACPHSARQLLAIFADEYDESNDIDDEPIVGQPVSVPVKLPYIPTHNRPAVTLVKPAVPQPTAPRFKVGPAAA